MAARFSIAALGDSTKRGIEAKLAKLQPGHDANIFGVPVKQLGGVFKIGPYEDCLFMAYTPRGATEAVAKLLTTVAA